MVNAKFKTTRDGLKKWSKQLSKLNDIINKCSYTFALLDGLEGKKEMSLSLKKIKIILENTPGK
jgi:hypothetical protein